MILLIWKLTMVWVCSIIVHEFGHYLWFRLFLNKKVKVRYEKDIIVGEPKDYEGLNSFQLLGIYYMGIYFGLIVLILYSMIEPYGTILLPFYLFGCKTDIKNILSILTKKEY